MNRLLGERRVQTVDLDRLQSPTTLTRASRSGRRELLDLRRKQAAAAAIATLDRRNEIYGFTKGQFSLLDLFEAVLEKTGPVDFVLSTWTAARHEIRRMAELRDAGKILSARWLVDVSFVRRDSQAAAAIRTAFGVDAIRVAQTHSKFALFKNRTWSLVLRSSMNLNMNPRFEDFTLANDQTLYDFLQTIVQEIWTKQRRSLADGPTGLAARFFRDEI